MSFGEESGRFSGWGVDKFDMFGSWGVLGSLFENRRGSSSKRGKCCRSSRSYESWFEALDGDGVFT